MEEYFFTARVCSVASFYFTGWLVVVVVVVAVVVVMMVVLPT
jgi:hypothetical protein